MFVGHSREPHRNGGTDRDAVWEVNSGRPKEPCKVGPGSPPHGKELSELVLWHA